MSNPSHTLASLLHRLGVGRRARLGTYQGSGAPKIGRLGPVLATLAATLGALALMTAPALAAAPETPETGKASAVTATTATLEGGVLNPNAPGEAGEYQFLYRASESQCEGESAAPEPAGIALGIEKEVVPPVKLAGLRPDTTYTFCLIERNAGGEVGPASPPVRFTTSIAPPTIASESPANVEATAATLEAQIDPDGLATTYHFEYGPTEAYGQSTSESGSIGADNVDHAATARISGLQPGSAYHYRVVATNSLSPSGGTPGPGKTFTTRSAPGSTPPESCPNELLRSEQPYGLELPECRAYEMVSPVEKNGNDATDPGRETRAASRAAVSGEALVFTSHGSFADPAGAQYENQFLARRGPAGWSTQSITAPFNDYNVAPHISPYENMVFTPELTEGVENTDASLKTDEAIEAPAGQFEIYRDDFAGGSYQWVSKDAPLISEERTAPYSSSIHLYSWFPIMGASTDLSHVVFSDENTGGVYEWIDGQVVDVGVANNGAFLGGVPGYVHTYEPVWRGGDVWNAVSSDGSRVFITGGNGELYVRKNVEREQSPMEAGRCTVPADACTVEISAGTPQYWGASVDGSKVFFTKGEDLNQYDVESGQTTALAEGGEVQGVVQISEDGSYVYFVAKGDLAGDAKAGQPNLYVSHGGVLTLIATLAEEDDEQQGSESEWGKYGFDQDETNVSPDGTRLAFVSERGLTGYDNEQAEPGECQITYYEKTGKCREVYLYDASTGGLTCVSCDPTGARPVGPSSLGEMYDFAPEHRRRNFSEDGSRLFFQSADALVPHASDGRRNVYEYEDGHVYPISDVAGVYESFFLDASASGNDVFIGTADQLLPQDRDNRIDVYDARVDGGFPVAIAPPPCNNGDSCKPPPSPQSAGFGAPASATFSGAGNLSPVAGSKPTAKPRGGSKPRQCKGSGTRKVEKRGRCIKEKPRKKAKKSSLHSEKGRK